MKKLARCFEGQPKVVQKIKFDIDAIGPEVNVNVDSDWAGCASTRKSTIGPCIMVGDICVKAWSTTQKVVALSSGEAEYYAAVKGASEGLGFLAGCADLGIWVDWKVSLRLSTDSSACTGICQRTGLGKIRHIDVALLWFQDLVRKECIKMTKVSGKDNFADMLTKYLLRGRCFGGCHLNTLRCGVQAARSNQSLEPRESAGSTFNECKETHCRSSWKGSAHALQL